MKAAIALLGAIGIGGGAVATVIAAPPHASTLSGEIRHFRPGPDSARVGRLFDAMRATDPALCEMLSDQIGNFWTSGSEDGIGRLADARRGVRAAKDSISGTVQDPAAIRLLAGTLSTDDPCVRRTAAKMLGNSTVADTLLRTLLTDAVPRVREAALLAISEQDRPALRADVERALDASDDATAAMAAYTLGELSDRVSLQPLLRAMNNRSTTVRASVVWALGEMEDPRAAGALRSALADPEALLRRLAAEALANLEGEQSPGEIERALARETDPQVRLAMVEALGSISSVTSATILAEQLGRGDLELAVASAEAIGDLDGLEKAPSALIAAARSKEAELRLAVAEALSNIEDAATIPVLIDLTRDAESEVRLAAVDGLGSIGHKDAIPALTKALTDADARVRRAATEALGDIGRDS